MFASITFGRIIAIKEFAQSGPASSSAKDFLVDYVQRGRYQGIGSFSFL
jgi:hypothetical protein